ncbi:AfsR/SARP family transcriptional regulator [Dermatobacter hominis]|uniref:AfsR/SARP family transcriptional regulator n=1 Tax=Dermatobacter hominis TaxID=2884263 RepID=UPI001D12E2B6|nr:BTAD domain-containing putative transcriptional regulator [Dermatobacter hominis]UDY34303.1 hypothetical protein LH044_13255 [Dermatobacter hominis]
MEGTEVRVLGPTVVIDGTGARPVRSAQLLRLLASLVIADGGVVDDDLLAERLWSGSPPPSARSGLQVVVHRLRGLLEPRGDGGDAPRAIVRTGSGYQLEPGAIVLDADHASTLVAAGERALPGHPDRAIGHLDEACACWRGDAWPALVDEPWMAAERARLHELRLRAEDARVDALLIAGLPGDATAAARRGVDAEPFRERRWAQLITGLYQDGRQRAALATYEEVRRRLADDLGVAPGPDLVRVHRAVLDHDPALAGGAPPSAPDRLAPAATLRRAPTPTTDLVGREDDLVRLVDALDGHRLVSVIGLGGLGKSAIAAHAADDRSDQHPDGCVVVAADALGDGRAVLDELADRLGVSVDDPQRRSDAVRTFVADRRILVVLDGCEARLDESADVARLLLAAGPGVRVLCTSRLPLDLPEEVTVALRPLGVPAADDADPLASPAVRLLLQRIGPDAAPSDDPDELAALVEIVQRVDGLPLAIELAAAQCRVLPLRSLATALGERMDVLASDERGRPERHRSLAACLDVTLDLVDDEAIDELQTLALLPAPASIDLLGVDRDPALLRRIDRLAAASLVRCDRGHVELLPTVRARALADVDTAATDRHVETLARRCTDFADRHRTALRIGPQARAIAAFGDQYDNLLAVVALLGGADRPGDAVRLVAALDRYWYLEPHGDDPRRTLGPLVDRARADGRTLDEAILASALAEATRAEDAGIPPHHDALRAAVPVLEAAGEHGRAIDALGLLVIGTGWIGELDEMAEHTARARSLRRTHLGDDPEAPWYDAVDRYIGAMVIGFSGDLAGALRGLLDARAEIAAVGDRALAGRVVLWAALVADALGDDDARHELLTGAVSDLSAGRLGGAQHKLLITVAELAVGDDDPEADRLLTEAIAAAEQRNDRLGVARCQRELGVLAARAGLDDRAAMWFRTALPTLAELDPEAFALALEEVGPLLERWGRVDEASCLRVAALGVPTDPAARTWDGRRLAELRDGADAGGAAPRPPGPDALRTALDALGPHRRSLTVQ